MVNIGVLCEGMTVSGHSTFIPNTSAVLHISYDGALFHGWSAGNDGSLTNIPSGGTQNCTLNKRGRSRRNKNRPSVKQGEVRSVQGILRAALAKIYGNVEINRVVVEGASRTDAGVSAKYMIALVYCLNDYTEEGAAGTFPIEGKRLPHPISPIDKGFKPLPFKSDLKKIVYALNKMLPPDVSVRNVSTMPLPTRSRQGEIYPFHPSLDSVCKTYSYTFSIGELYDPIKIR
jgi:tRNA U38,U39,U40 pseudouridine synthase TruA